MKEQIQAYLDGLNDRERRLVMGGVVVLIVIIAYQFIWSPFIGGLDKLTKKVEQQQQDILWMQNSMQELRELSKFATKSEGASTAVYSTIENSARTKFGANSQVQQEGQRGVRVQISNIAFDDVMLWLDELKSQQQIVIKEFSAESTGASGYVKSSILLEG